MWDNLFYKLSINLKISFYQIKKKLLTNKLKTNIYNSNDIGSDLIVSSYAILYLFPKQDVILINMGTATTISLLKKEILIGIIIMPGLKISAEALFKKTQLLKKNNFFYNKKILGKNTKQAINIGLVTGHLLTIISFINKIKISYNIINPKIVLTGGNSNYIKKIVNYHYEKNLIFKGLIAILKDNKLL